MGTKNDSTVKFGSGNPSDDIVTCTNICPPVGGEVGVLLVEECETTVDAEDTLAKVDSFK